MRGLGTIINALAIVIGGVLGILFKRFLKERYQDTIIKATGFSVVFLGAAGTLSKILTVRPDGTLSTGGSMVMILSLALGALLGELIDLDVQFERFGEWLKHKTGSDGDNQFVNGFVGDRGGEHHAIDDLDLDVGGGGSLGQRHDATVQDVASR